ncbi:MAG: DUF3365 domain-containing protein [Nitrospira sp.]|nr:DUF3365 domain-containing protein [Nitrospira sp.]
MMKWSSLIVIPLIVVTWFPMQGGAADTRGLSPEVVADYVHAVVESHRAFYTAHVVAPLEEQEAARASGEWRNQKKTVPLPVQIVNETSQMFSTQSTGLRYQLISLWPINRKNGPRNEIDKKSLETVIAKPERPATRIVKINGHSYFQAIYADIALSPSCVTCHNSHPDSPKKDYQAGDVMGGLIIEFPLGKQ